MRKKIICLSIIAGLFLSVGLGVSKKDIGFGNITKQNNNSISLNDEGQVLFPPEVYKPNISLILNF